MKKDLEREQNGKYAGVDKAKEKKRIKQEKKKAKKKGRFMRNALLVAIVLLIIGFIIGKYGFGLGGSGDSQNSTVDSTENVSQAATSSKNTVSVSVIESDYFYDNKKLSLEELMTKLKSFDDICVEITSDNAALKAYNSLTDELKNNSIEYVEKN